MMRRKERGLKPFFVLSDFAENPAQAVFDLIEWRFYDLAPSLLGIPGRAELRDNAVYLTYSLSDAIRYSYEKFVVVSSDWKKLVARSYSLQNVIYSLIFLDEFDDDPDMVFSILFNYYASQQFLRVFISPSVVSWLSRMGVDPEVVQFDEVPVMDSLQPRHRGIVAFGYKRALRREYPELKFSSRFLESVKDYGLDYVAKVLDHVRIVAWAQYFAQTEDAYVYGLIKEYLRKYGRDKDFDFFKDVIKRVNFFPSGCWYCKKEGGNSSGH